MRNDYNHLPCYSFALGEEIRCPNCGSIVEFKDKTHAYKDVDACTEFFYRVAECHLCSCGISFVAKIYDNDTMKDTSLPRYNHAFTIAFSHVSTDETGEGITGGQMRKALQARIKALSDEDMVEAVGMPFDTYREP